MISTSRERPSIVIVLAMRLDRWKLLCFIDSVGEAVAGRLNRGSRPTLRGPVFWLMMPMSGIAHSIEGSRQMRDKDDPASRGDT
jgi:hypothetical protein